MYRESFSSRYNVRFGTAEEFTEDVTEEFRRAFVNLLSRFIDKGALPGWTGLYRVLCETTRKVASHFGDITHEKLSAELAKEPWYFVIDFIEHVSDSIRAYDTRYEEMNGIGRVYAPAARDEYFTLINGLFVEERLQYYINTQGVHRRLPGEIVSIENRILTLTSGIDRGNVIENHLQKARNLLSLRPEPDLENCIKELVSALESTAKILSKDDNVKLDKFLDSNYCQAALHGAARSLIKKFYGFASEEGGIRHGSGSVQGRIGIEDVIFSYYQALSAIELLLAKVPKDELLESDTE